MGFAIVWSLLVALAGIAGCAANSTPAASITAAGSPVKAIGFVPDQSGLAWYDVRSLEIEGAGWPDAVANLRRLPDRAHGVVREPVWQLAQHTSGLRARFVTDATEISVQWTLRDPKLALDHMPASGVSGFDLYARDGDKWQWAGVARPNDVVNTERIIKNIPAVPHEYLLYFPLYNSVESAAIGLNAGATFQLLPADTARPLVFYGTSITQGASASRPGMNYTAQLSRRLNVPFINLGFAGNGTMDPELATYLAEIDARVYVIDCLPNMDADAVTSRAPAFLAALRKARPDTPIVLVESIVPRNAWLLPWQGQAADKNNEALRAVIEHLDDAARRHLYAVSNEHLLGPTTESAVDGLHPTDLGFTCMADALEPVLRRALRCSRSAR